MYLIHKKRVIQIITLIGYAIKYNRTDLYWYALNELEQMATYKNYQLNNLLARNIDIWLY